MLALESVLFPTDFSETADRALPWALFLAETHDARLEMLHAVVLHASDPADPEHHFPELEEVHRRLRERAGERMSALLEGHDVEGLEVETFRERGISPAPVILEHAARLETDLVVMGTHGRRGLRRFLLGSVAREVLRLAEAATLVVPPAGEWTGSVRKILVPVDFSEHSVSALSHARHLAHTLGAQLELAHVQETQLYPDLYPVPVPDPAETRERCLQALGKSLDRSTGPDVDTGTHLLFGRAAGALADFAGRAEIDLVVMASHGLTGLERVLLGSVTERLVGYATCPVFVLKAFGRSLLPA